MELLQSEKALMRHYYGENYGQTRDPMEDIPEDDLYYDPIILEPDDSPLSSCAWDEDTTQHYWRK
eukprot:4524671-Prorocentrum_lima.AAC.1